MVDEIKNKFLPDLSNLLRKMAARNVSGSAQNGDSDSSDEELSRIAPSGAKAKPPRINYGDRMPFRQGRKSLILLLIVFCKNNLVYVYPSNAAVSIRRKCQS